MSGLMLQHVLLVDDHPIVRLGLAALLGSHCPGVRIAEAGTLTEARTALATTPPQLTLLDINMGRGNGLQLLPELRAAGSRVLVLSIRDEASIIEQALAAGADGYLIKDAAGKELAQALAALTQGQRYLPPNVAVRLAGRQGLQAPQGVDSLSARELEVFLLVAQGLGKGEMAARLGISANTVETHRQKLKQKLGADSQHALLKLALAHTGRALPTDS